ncbi:MAG: M12 family metallo-peptidase [Planctomycetota bacterium]|nr:M12 family metallo-peptidase [Planctomycetota bacterium]
MRSPLTICLAFSTLAISCLGARPALAQQSPAARAATNLRALSASPEQPFGPRVVRLSPDAQALAALAGAAAGTVIDLPLPSSDGQTTLASLDLARTSVFAPGAKITVVTDEGPQEREPAAVLSATFFSGSVRGVENSRVFLAVTPAGALGSAPRVDALILTGAEQFVISSGPEGANLAPVIYSVAALEASGAMPIERFSCGVGTAAMPASVALNTPMRPVRASTGAPARARSLADDSLAHSGQPDQPGAFEDRDAPCRIAQVAIETDFEFREGFTSTAAAANYAAFLIGAVSEIYAAEFNTRLQIPYLRIWDTANDPWTVNGTIDLLYQFQEHWNANMTGVSRSIVHMLSPRRMPQAGGVAYLGVICYPEYDYGVSAYLNLSFPYPLGNNLPQNWDPFVVAHEIGHNFGTGHTHDSYTPVIDNCGNGDCNSPIPANQGTIMSYCHTCAGGMSNIRLEMGPRVAAQILTYLDTEAVCDLSASGVTLNAPLADTAGCPANPGVFVADASGTGTLRYEWRVNGALQSETGPVLFVGSCGGDASCAVEVTVADACGNAVTSSATFNALPPCAADFDRSCFLDSDDFSSFVGAFIAGQPSADFDGTGFLDSDDFVAFVQAFEAGC